MSLAAKSGTPEDALELLEELRATVKDEVTAARLDEQMKLATLERDAQALERAAERFRAQTGRDPLSLEELVWTGHVRALPKDPFGGVYRWDPAGRKVRSTANAFRFSPREGPQDGVAPPPPKFEFRRKSE
jgi:hypothetical protein